MEFVLEDLKQKENIWLFTIFISSSINYNFYPETWENPDNVISMEEVFYIK